MPDQSAHNPAAESAVLTQGDMDRLRASAWPLQLPTDHAALIAEIVREHMAQAWDEGMRTGTSRAMRRMSDEPSLPLASASDNPYSPAAGGEDRG